MTLKVDYLRQKKLNPADELRELLSSLEESSVNLDKLSSAQALSLLQELDRVDELLAQLEATGANLAPERGRFEAAQAHLKHKAGTILNRLGGPAALSEHRPSPAPNRERWWWYIHEMVAAQQQRLLRQVAIVLVVVLLLLGAVFVAFNTILAPSPEAVARVEAENDAFSFYDEGDYEAAVAAVDRGLAVIPNDAGLLVLKGVMLEALGREAEAADSFEQAKLYTDPPVNFYLARGQLYIRTNQLVKAEEDVRAALAMDDQIALAWLLLGQSLESQGKRFESISAYEQAGELALESGDSQIVVLARLALGRVVTSP
jgi:tetratricopeptide (TPR) repeat protein